MYPVFALAVLAGISVLTLSWLVASAHAGPRVRVWALYQRARLLTAWSDHNIQRAAAGHALPQRDWVARLLGVR
jgi:hypothetical protein